MERLGEITVADIRARLASPRPPSPETVDAAEEPAARPDPDQPDLLNRIRWAELRSWLALLIALAALLVALTGADAA